MTLSRPLADLAPPLDRQAPRLRRNRRIALSLNALTVAALIAGMVGLMSYNGIVALEWAMLVPYALTLPWLSIGLWNAVIGLALSRRHADAAAHVTPHLARIGGDEPIVTRTAIVMPIRNESAPAAIRRMEALQADLARTPWLSCFDFHVLSDTSDPATAAREETLVAEWRLRAPGVNVHYRRRAENTGFKAGNIAEFLDRRHADYDFFLPLDADSAMGARAVLRLVRVMQASPTLGMLQGLVVGTPSRTFFTRAFQFGMRHGMRSFTLGAAWWQGDCGPSWGHNVLIRTAPFHAHCRLPRLPGRGPLGGDILSHDQVEAALMRRAGYEVRVLADEDDSFEDNPPSLPDFIVRELRWCHGNMQYLRLLGLPGLQPLSRVQLALAILMYVSPAAWFAFMALGAGLAGMDGQFEGVPFGIGVAFFATIMALNLAPKIMGLAQVLADRGEAARYGGRTRVVAGGAAEFVFSLMIAPVVAFSIAIGVVRLALGRRVTWEAQKRRRRGGLSWREATAALWPHTLAGAGLAAYLSWVAPWALWFAAPVYLALGLAIPVAVLTTRRALGAWACRTGLFSIPEEGAPRGEGPGGALPQAA